MSNQSIAAQRRARAIEHMEKALIELDEAEDSIIAMRLQHALDVARGDRGATQSLED